MKSIFLYFVLICLGWAPSIAQTCPSWSDKQALLQFLEAHRSNSLEADPRCVNRAFATLSRDKSYTKDLVQLLDFERSTKEDDALLARSSQYPAISALARNDAVPYLVAAIKTSDRELVRTNAAEALDLLYRACVKNAVKMLENEAEQSGLTAEQQDRLRTAGQYINKHLGPRPCRFDRSTP